MPADITPLIRREAPKAWPTNPICKSLSGPFRRYAALKAVSVLLGVYVAVWTFAPEGTFGTTGGLVGPTGYIVDDASSQNAGDGVIYAGGSYPRAIAASDALQMACLGITRVSAFFMYPSLVVVFATKFRASMQLVLSSSFSPFAYDDLHQLHVFTGWVVILDGVVHTAFHVVRWADQGNLRLLIDHRSGISGLVCVACVLLIGLPMGIEALRSRIGYEARKVLHYLFVAFCVSMAFHAPLSAIPNGGFAPIVFPCLIIWWALDALYCSFFMTERIDTSTFRVLPAGTGAHLTMTISLRFQRSCPADGGYCYVNFPWINRWQWHAYCLFENPADPAEREVYIQNLGDWSGDVLEALRRDTRRPVWVQGPFSRPYDTAMESDNQILVASGIGITPAISIMRKHQNTRRSSLIWAVRDPHMLEFFVKHGEFPRRGWNMVFYTGKQALYVGDTNEVVTSSGALVHIIRARPNLHDLIPNIIYSIESGEHVPEAFAFGNKSDAIARLQEKLSELDELNLTSQQKMTELVKSSNDLGFLFTDLMREIAKDDDASKINAKYDNEESKKEEDGVQMLHLLQSHKSTNHISADAAPSGTTSAKARAALRTVESGMNSWREEFEGNGFKPWKEDSAEAREYVNLLDREKVLSTWGALYCGGQGPLTDALKKTTNEFSISLAMESFKW